MIISTNLPHALLINGNSALLLPQLQQDLQYLLCESTDLQLRGKDQCTSCNLFLSEAGHPDLLFVRPEGKLNITKIDTVREVIIFLEKSAMRGGMRIVIFTEADTLNIAAQNALLKSLEEPGVKTLIILITAKPHLLLPTIKSRCQMLQANNKKVQENTELAKELLSEFDPMAFTERNKDLDLLTYTRTQMLLIHDLLTLRYGGKYLSFESLSIKLNQLALRISSHSLWQAYKILVEKSELFQKKVAVNHELCLFELTLAWQRLIAQNTHS